MCPLLALNQYVAHFAAFNACAKASPQEVSMVLGVKHEGALHIDCCHTVYLHSKEALRSGEVQNALQQ